MTNSPMTPYNGELEASEILEELAEEGGKAPQGKNISKLKFKKIPPSQLVP